MRDDVIELQRHFRLHMAGDFNVEHRNALILFSTEQEMPFVSLAQGAVNFSSYFFSRMRSFYRDFMCKKFPHG
jgi:hypothetical protein